MPPQTKRKVNAPAGSADKKKSPAKSKSKEKEKETKDSKEGPRGKDSKDADKRSKEATATPSKEMTQDSLIQEAPKSAPYPKSLLLRTKSTLDPAKRENAKLVLNFVESTLKKGFQTVRGEFAKHKRALDKSKMLVFAQNPTKNRYRDVGCYDNCRVILLNNGPSDYIHANYVSSPKSKRRFICCQAPLPSTLADHWRMLVQEKSDVVLMLCNFIESKKEKCAHYFPESTDTPMTFGPFTVKCVNREQLKLDCTTTAVIMVTSLVVEENGVQVHKLEHYHWLDWPDRGVPTVDLAPIKLLEKISPTQTPIVIHCSAGIGRTGAICLLQYALESIATGQPCEQIDVLMIKLREQRANSVQTDAQYLYVHQLLLHYFEMEGYLDASIEKPLQQFRDKYEDYASKFKT